MKTEKRNYVISKSLPNVRDQHPKMEIGQKQSFMYTLCICIRIRLHYFSYSTIQYNTQPNDPPLPPAKKHFFYTIFFLQRNCGIAKKQKTKLTKFGIDLFFRYF